MSLRSAAKEALAFIIANGGGPKAQLIEEKLIKALAETKECSRNIMSLADEYALLYDSCIFMVDEEVLRVDDAREALLQLVNNICGED